MKKERLRLFALAFLIAGGATRIISTASNAFHFPLTVLETQVLLTAGFMVLWAVLARNQGEKWGLKWPGKNDWKKTFAALGLMFIIGILGRVLSPDMDAWYAGIAWLHDWTYVQQMLLTWIPLAVILEEVAVRGILQSKLQQRFSPKIAILSAALFFAFMHAYLLTYSAANAYGIASFLMIIAQAFLITLLYYWTRSWIATGILHLVANTFAAFQTFFHVSGQLELEFLIWGIWAIALIAYKDTAARFVQQSISIIKKPSKESGGDWMFLAVVIALPLVFLFVF
ncbi:CPBP family intramembrane metalloprotease [Candidatus Micrarchaeota archaeon]|nr:CPBP family intramembrane metalloprotease [Candidatus Micrarchaeota archaeon]